MAISNRLIVGIAFASVALATLSVGADEPFAYDGFQYGPSPDMQGANGGFGWSNAWGQVQQIPTGIGDGGLSYPNLATAGNCAVTAPFPSSAFTIYTRVLSPYSAEDNLVYVSFLLEPESGFGDGGGLSFSATPQVIVGDALGSGFYGLTEPFTSTSVSDVPVVAGETTLLVTRIEKHDDGTVTYSLHVNPTVGAPEPAEASCSISLTGNLPQIASIINDGGYVTDEIRFGKTWASVLPALVPACPADLNHDGVVNGADLSLLLGDWGGPGGDLDGDGTTNGSDLAVLLGGWGSC